MKNWFSVEKDVLEAKIFRESNNDAEQAFNSIRIVRAYGQESNEICKFKDHSSKHDQEVVKFSQLYGFSTAIFDSLVQIGFLFLITISSIFILERVSFNLSLIN